MISPRERNALYSRLQEVLGPDQAATLMTMLPEGEDLATRSDLAEVRSRLTHLESDVAELKRDVAELKGDVAYIKGDGAELKTSVRDLHAAIHAQARTFVVTQTSTVLAVAGLVFAFDRFL